MIVDKKQLSKIFGVSERTITEWQKNGMPVQSKSVGTSNGYETVDVIAWRIASSTEKDDETESHGIALTRERARKTKAEADRVELRLAKEKQELLEADIVFHAWSEILADVRQSVLQFPMRITPLILGLEDETKIKEVITAEVKASLQSLARTPNYEQELEEIEEGESTEEQQDNS